MLIVMMQFLIDLYKIKYMQAAIELGRS